MRVCGVGKIKKNKNNNEKCAEKMRKIMRKKRISHPAAVDESTVQFIIILFKTINFSTFKIEIFSWNHNTYHVRKNSEKKGYEGKRH